MFADRVNYSCDDKFTIILAFDLEDQGHTLFQMVDFIGLNVKNNSLRSIVCEIS